MRGIRTEEYVGFLVARISFLARLIFLKAAALFTFIICSLYMPSAMNSMLDGAGAASKWLATHLESAFMYLGRQASELAFLIPKKGAFELTFRFVGVDKVVLFIGFAVALYLAWLLVLFLLRRYRG